MSLHSSENSLQAPLELKYWLLAVALRRNSWRVGGNRWRWAGSKSCAARINLAFSLHIDTHIHNSSMRGVIYHASMCCISPSHTQTARLYFFMPSAPF